MKRFCRGQGGAWAALVRGSQVKAEVKSAKECQLLLRMIYSFPTPLQKYLLLSANSFFLDWLVNGRSGMQATLTFAISPPVPSWEFSLSKNARVSREMLSIRFYTKLKRSSGICLKLIPRTVVLGARFSNVLVWNWNSELQLHRVWTLCSCVGNQLLGLYRTSVQAQEIVIHTRLSLGMGSINGQTWQWQMNWVAVFTLQVLLERAMAVLKFVVIWQSFILLRMDMSLKHRLLWMAMGILHQYLPLILEFQMGTQYIITNTTFFF